MKPAPLDQTPIATKNESPTLTSATFEDLVREMLVRLGEDPTREGLTATPERVHKAMKFLTKGYQEDPEALLKGALFHEKYDEMVIVKDVEMFSLCEHHLLPFFGKVHVAYIPNGRVIGLSKIPRLIELFSPPPANSRAPHHADRRDHPESNRAARRRRGHRSPPSLHDDARRRKAALRRGHVVHARLLPQRRRNALRIPVADPPAPQRRLGKGSRFRLWLISWFCLSLRPPRISFAPSAVKIS